MKELQEASQDLVEKVKDLYFEIFKSIGWISLVRKIAFLEFKSWIEERIIRDRKEGKDAR